MAGPPVANHEPLVISCREAARLLKVTPIYFYRMIIDKRAPPVVRLGKKGRLMRIKWTDFTQWLEEQKNVHPDDRRRKRVVAARVQK